MQRSSDTLERLLSLVPVHHRARDAAPRGDGTLTALLTAVAGELELLERDLERLYDGWFIETCEEWLVPYLADLVGLHEVPPDLGVAVSRRALVANTVAYRRRKGTVAVLEQVARDVTGWPTRAVEYHPLLATSAHVNHVRLDRAAAPSLRGAARLEQAAVTSPPAAARVLDPLPHTVEVRRIASRRGRYGISNVGIFPFPVQTYAVGAARTPPGRGPADGWSRTSTVAGWHHFDPLGRATPLFAPPRAEAAIELLATEPDLPVPLRPRRLLELLRLGVLRGGAPARRADRRDRHRLAARAHPRVPDRRPARHRGAAGHDRSDRGAPARLPQANPSDPVAHYVPQTVFVRWAYGALADVGAGTHDRSDTHERALAGDLWTRAADGDLQVAVPNDEPTVVDALDDLTWTPGTTTFVSIGDSEPLRRRPSRSRCRRPRGSCFSPRTGAGACCRAASSRPPSPACTPPTGCGRTCRAR